MRAAQSLHRWAARYPLIRRVRVWPLTLSVAAAAPYSSVEALISTARLSLWVFTLDDLFDEERVPRGELLRRAERYRAIAHDQPTASARDSLATALREVHAVVERSGIEAGTVTASTRHTTCALVAQESEPLLLSDMADRLRRYAGAHEAYRHNDFSIRTVNVCAGECANGHAHCQHLLPGAAVSLPLSAGRLVVGPWQRLFLVELDRPRLRHYSIQVMGVRASA